MDLEELLSILDCSTIQIVAKGVPKKKFSAVSIRGMGGNFYSAPIKTTDITFADISYFNKLPSSSLKDAAFFLFTDEPLKPLSSNAFIATIKNRADWFSAIETIDEEFRILQQKTEQILHLTFLANRNVSLTSIVNEAADIVGAPASLLDNSLSFLACSDDFPFYVALGNEKTTGLLPDAALPLLKARSLVNPQKPFPPVVFDWKAPDGTIKTNHFCLIHSRDTILGSLSFHTADGHLRQSRQDMIPAIAQIISIYLSRSNALLLNKSLYYAHLFKQLEEGTLTQSREQIETRFSLFGYELKQFLHIFVVDFSREFLPSEHVRSLAEQIHPYIHNSVYTIGETDIVFLSSSDEILAEGDFDPKLERIFDNSTITVGISSVYMNPKHTPSYINEAKRANITGHKIDPNKHVFPFERYRLLDLAANVIDNKTLYSYRFPPLMHIIDYDSKHNTHLAYTLYEYLQNPTHPTDVAKRLYIHKNTLYYRLEKIREIMGQDFKDAETIASIQMTFHVLRIQNRFEKLVVRPKHPAHTSTFSHAAKATYPWSIVKEQS